MTALVELIGTLKRTFSTMRLYGLGHDNSATAEGQLFTALTGYLDQHGSLAMVIHLTSMEVDGVKVIEEERRDESLVRPLFIDGVESLTFLAGVTKEELSLVIRAWYGAITQTLGSEHSFATWMWEHEPKSIVASVRPGIADMGADDSKEARAAEGRLRQLFDALTARALPSDAAKPMAVVDVASLEVVRQVLGEVSADSLEKKASADDALGLDLTKNDRATMASSMTQWARGAGQRTLFALWRGFEERPDEATLRLISRVIDELVPARIGEVARALARIGEDSGPEAEAVRGRLAERQTLAALIEALDASAEALPLIAAIPASSIDALAEHFASASPEVKSRLVPIIVQKNPSGERLAMWLLAHGSKVAASLFDMSEKLDPSVREMLVRTALVHDDVDVLIRGLGKINATTSDAFRSLVEPQLKHADADVRRAALGVYVRSHDPAVPGLIHAQLADPAAPLDWQKSCVTMLGTFGGPSAAGVLVGILDHNKSKELRVAAAQALGGIDAPAGKEALSREANKLFGDRAVKKAAKEALARLEKKRSSLVPNER